VAGRSRNWEQVWGPRTERLETPAEYRAGRTQELVKEFGVYSKCDGKLLKGFWHTIHMT
jgi:hypothetical protein